MADQSHPIPKHSRISRAIIALVQGGDIAPRAWIPFENEIIDQYKVSNTTPVSCVHPILRFEWTEEHSVGKS